MLKKIFLLFLTLFLLCACTEKKTVAPILNNLTFISQFDYKNEKYICETQLSDGRLNLCVVAPQIIRDLSLTVDQNGVSSNFKGLECEFAANEINKNSVATTVFDIITDINNGKKTVLNDENCIIEGEVDNIKYVYTYSPSGLPIGLKVDKLNLDIKFKNVTFKQK